MSEDLTKALESLAERAEVILQHFTQGEFTQKETTTPKKPETYLTDEQEQTLRTFVYQTWPQNEENMGKKIDFSQIKMAWKTSGNTFSINAEDINRAFCTDHNYALYNISNNQALFIERPNVYPEGEFYRRRRSINKWREKRYNGNPPEGYIKNKAQKYTPAEKPLPAGTESPTYAPINAD